MLDPTGSAAVEARGLVKVFGEGPTEVRALDGGLESLVPGIAFSFPLRATVGVALLAVALGVVAAILPARRAARLKPIEALTYE